MGKRLTRDELIDIWHDSIRHATREPSDFERTVTVESVMAAVVVAAEVRAGIALMDAPPLDFMPPRPS